MFHLEQNITNLYNKGDFCMAELHELLAVEKDVRGTGTKIIEEMIPDFSLSLARNMIITFNPKTNSNITRIAINISNGDT